MRFISSLFICLIIGFNALAAHAKISPALWEIDANGTKSYLLGTVHVGDTEMNGLPQYIETAISNSDKVVVEVDVSAMTPLQIQQRSMPYLLLKNGEKLKQQITAANYQKLSDYFKNKNIDIALFATLKPWAVLLTVAQIEYQALGFSENYGIDKQVLALAKSNNKPVGELETFEQQLQMFDSMQGYEDAMVEDTFEQLNDIEGYFTRLINGWKAGDMAVLDKYYDQSFDDSEFGKLNEQVLLVKRNKNWVEQLSQTLPNTSQFIAVGALHLPRENGLLALLEEQGFKVTRVQ